MNDAQMHRLHLSNTNYWFLEFQIREKFNK